MWRLGILQRAESEFDPVPFDAEAARIDGFTANPADFAGLDALLSVIPVTRQRRTAVRREAQSREYR